MDKVKTTDEKSLKRYCLSHINGNGTPCFYEIGYTAEDNDCDTTKNNDNDCQETDVKFTRYCLSHINDDGTPCFYEIGDTAENNDSNC